VALGGPDPAAALRLSRADAAALALLRAGAEGAQRPGEIAWRHGPKVAEDVVLLRAAMAGTPLPEGWEAEVAAGAAAEFPVRAADLMPALSGPALGARLKALEARWIASGFTLTREALLA
jgi:poly(A) polymerase